MLSPELIVIETQKGISGPVTAARIEHHIARAVLILDMAREPRTADELHVKLGIPIASTYRLLNALLKLGWLRHAGSRVVAGAHGFGPAKMYVATSPRIPMYPHPCGECRMTLYSSEHEALHSCR